MLEILKKRRSIRAYEDIKLTEEQVQLLVKAALWSPTSKNLHAWDFIVVDNPELLEALSQAKSHGGSFLKGAGLGIVVLGDSAVTDVWVEDASIAAAIIQLTAESMGLGSCWVQIRERQNKEGKAAGEVVQELLEIPANKQVVAIISLGYGKESKRPHSEEELKYEKVHSNQYGTPFVR